MPVTLPQQVVLCAALATACATAEPTPRGPAPQRERILVALPVESDVFPRTATLVSDHLRRARVVGYAEPKLSKVSLEIVQLSIECFDPTLECYQTAGKHLQADAILFAVIEPTAQKDELVITVSLFDVASKSWIRRAAKKFPTEDDVPYDIREVVSKVTAK